jgi:hypothetical protein
MDWKKTLTAAVTALATLPDAASARIITWSGFDWTVKASDEPVSPGKNYWSDSENSVWVDDKDQLHLSIRRDRGNWRCSEVTLIQSLGYGRYIFYLASRADQFNKNVVLGMFTYADDNNEIDIEMSRWGQDNRYCFHQFATQPHKVKGNKNRVEWRNPNPSSAHGFIWNPKSILFASFINHNTGVRKPFRSWLYQGASIPKPCWEKASINLWLYNGKPPDNDEQTELVLSRFEFTPATY